MFRVVEDRASTTKNGTLISNGAKMNKAFAAAASAAVLAAVAASPASAASSFDGPYVGAHIGYGFGNLDLSVSSPIGPGVGGELDSAGMSGFAGGLLAGYGLSFGQVYLGGEVEGSYTGLEATASASIGGLAGVGAKADTDWSGGLSVRAGYLATSGVLLYGRLGATVTHFNFEGSAWASGLGGVSASDDRDLWGVTAGLGIEAAVADHIKIRGEYLHTWYDTVDWNVGGFAKVSLDPTVGLARLAVIYSF